MSDDALPQDSVLRRHAMTERNRVLGLPPTDSVLKRHFAQLQAASASAPAAMPRAAAPVARAASAPAPKAAPAPAAKAAAQPAPAARPAPAPAPAAAPAQVPSGGGGFLGWLKRLFGA